MNNVPAITFYKRRGYTIFKTISRYYVDNIDAYLPGSSRGPWVRYERLLLPST